ncbi:3-hexulose-6-phosphate synthase [Weissella cibaria]|jgi:3-hexulose-6-phosphate synthase|uniref:3-hexulose-6-phosphate synthase n=1 Tax=Weissella cibaria TaxID=137591 RepID=UPI000E4AD2FA|nr:3-hexulose-6-phosphate synthase [Weissella cibaria]MCS9988394.1 3-hexulose-6-phosphate synthase [Weissella cibaria]MCT0000839.1 3-hexulose-6-phosphate synthase [Weissella cibaria]MCU7539345.1 3-hexulose-6-phosphate synthase [Weissella cibaria]RHE69412.1 3-hexulose-6-phosphate synthase [Weissella cibaria]RHE75566.1 3-hexulose-6-phosphate synthase [Weissella cibaria]
MKLQLAIDLEDIQGAINLIRKTKDSIDIFEYGTPLVINFGLEGLQKIRTEFPDITLLADLKIMDVASYEVTQAFKYGADITTILGVAEDQSIKDAIKTAHEAGKEILVDMIGVQDIENRAREVDEFGADYVGTHTGYDLQALGQNPFEEFNLITNNVSKTKTAIAGGIKLSASEEIKKANPDLLIIGGAISTADDPAEAAAEFKKILG